MLLYDYREEKSGIPALLTFANIPIESKRLPVGDYLISDKMIIERKTAADLVNSIKDRRLFDQGERMIESFPLAVLIVEHDALIKFPEKSWKGALVSLIRKGITVIETDSAQATSEYLTLIYNQENKSQQRPKSSGKQKKITSDNQAIQYALSVIPGISLNLAETLLQHFGSLPNLCDASLQDLQQIERIGKKRSETIYRILHHQWNSTPY
jgi:ERCC4-type nuclease